MDATDKPAEAPKPPRDWGLLAEMLKAQWRECDLEEFPLHRGLFEGRYEVARKMSLASPGEREDAAYAFLVSTLMHSDRERRDE